MTTNPQLGVSYTLTCSAETHGGSYGDFLWLNPNNDIIQSNDDLQVGNIMVKLRRVMRNLTFTKLSTANSGSYSCQASNNKTTSSLVTNGMTHFMQHCMKYKTINTYYHIKIIN